MSEDKKEYCGKCFKLDRPKSFCDRYRTAVIAHRSAISRARDAFEKLTECQQASKPKGESDGK